MKNAVRTVLIGLTLALYLLAIGSVGIRTAASKTTAPSTSSSEYAFTLAQGINGIQDHFISVETGTIGALVRLKISTSYLNLSCALEQALDQQAFRGFTLSADVSLQPRLRQLIFPFHSFW
ncbi:MAG: hypothetical protein K9J17_11565 [Flavobacteriales bacterium]|nr:hypothetical protein [Flavobacteriales bacterium]